MMMDDMMEPRTLVSPELQVLTPGYMIGFLNSMTTLIHAGVSGPHCGEGFEQIGIETKRWFRGDEYKICPKGVFKYEGGATEADTLQAMNVLLTGGRLSGLVRETVQTAFQDAPSDSRIQA